MGEGAQELGPERLGFRVAERRAQPLPPAVRVDGERDDDRDRHHAAVTARFDVRRVEPQVRPFALDGPVQKRADTLIDLTAEPRDLALADARATHRLHQGSTLRVETPWMYASWITAVSAFSAVRRGSRKAGK